MLHRFDLRPSDAAVWAFWLLAVAAFVALAASAHAQHPLPFDERATLWVQDLDRVPSARQYFEFANTAGSPDTIAALAIVLCAGLLLTGRRFEAMIVGGVVAMRLVQLAVRHSIDWPAGQAEYFYTTNPLPDGGSFPSGHVLGQVLVYGLLAWFAPRLFSSSIVVNVLRSYCVLVIVLGGPARLYVGAHWPSDVIGSMLLATLYLLPALWLDARRSRSPRRREVAEDQVRWASDSVTTTLRSPVT